MGQPGAHATHHAHIIAVDPRNPRQLIRGWFSWRGAEFNDPKFGAEAEAFFASFQRAG